MVTRSTGSPWQFTNTPQLSQRFGTPPKVLWLSSSHCAWITIDLCIFFVTDFIKANPEYLAKPNMMDWLSDDGGETYNRCHFWSNFEVHLDPSITWSSQGSRLIKMWHCDRLQVSISGEEKPTRSTSNISIEPEVSSTKDGVCTTSPTCFQHYWRISLINRRRCAGTLYRGLFVPQTGRNAFLPGYRISSWTFPTLPEGKGRRLCLRSVSLSIGNKVWRIVADTNSWSFSNSGDNFEVHGFVIQEQFFWCMLRLTWSSLSRNDS